MGHTLLDRLTGQSDDQINYPNIAVHGFNACICEYARKADGGTGLTKGSIASNYNVDGGDTQANALLDLITNAASGEKLIKAQEIIDILTIHENYDSKPLYPDKSSIVTRLGI